MQIVYLDQNKWIELARVARGRIASPELRLVLDALRQARASRDACFPLSYAHYIETRKRRDRQSRVQLASFMLELSQQRTIRANSGIVEYELHRALRQRFPRQVKAKQAKALNLIGLGVSHAFGYPPFKMPMTESFLTAVGVSGEDTREIVQREIELVALTGISAAGREVPDADSSPTERRFLAGLAELQVHELTPSIRENFLFFRAMEDVREPLQEAAEAHAIPMDRIKALGEYGLRDLLEDMPSVRVDMHLHRQWAKNKSLPAKMNEGYDIGCVGLAAMYCDVVVTEHKLADLLQRDGFQCRAQVLTDLRSLPDSLGSRN